jgi:hypothetical protein
MHCNSCGTDVASRVRSCISSSGEILESCDVCANISPVWLPDVYLGGPGGSTQTDECLCNPETGKPIPFSTKREKAAVMRMLNVKQAECAERQHGARNESHLHRKKYFI